MHEMQSSIRRSSIHLFIIYHGYVALFTKEVFIVYLYFVAIIQIHISIMSNLQKILAGRKKESSVWKYFEVVNTASDKPKSRCIVTVGENGKQ